MLKTAQKTVFAFCALALLVPAAAIAAAPLELTHPEVPVPMVPVTAIHAPLELEVSAPQPVEVVTRPTLRVAGFDLASAGEAPQVKRTGARLQCVTYARMLTGFNLFGDAKTWWAQAKGLYDLLYAPKAGAVMVFAGTDRMRHGHVAVVKDVISSREVLVDHANWGNDGKVYLNMPVFDVSPKNDWSLVKVWNTKTGGMGSHAYPVKGFVAE